MSAVDSRRKLSGMGSFEVSTVLPGLLVAAECRAILAISPGDAAFRIVSMTNQAGNELDSRRWSSLLDLSLASVGDKYDASLVACAQYGHFTEPDRPWEVFRL